MNLDEFCVCVLVLWKVELEHGEIGCLAEISKQNVQRGTLFLLIAHGKIDRDELKRNCYAKRKQNLKFLRNSQPVHLVKNEKSCSEKEHQGCSWTIT